jgi:hypothetical protein
MVDTGWATTATRRTDVGWMVVIWEVCGSFQAHLFMVWSRVRAGAAE